MGVSILISRKKNLLKMLWLYVYSPNTMCWKIPQILSVILPARTLVSN